ncbi:apolipoprotein A-II [Chelmon rostratus]|uniref:apolipoprotein A-II n=1 Tax=Chelmon rostratus TaxID=109905 RepID=UPI001BEA6701|nr:apolipoprotein A-II [Chelmon rostratus]
MNAKYALALILTLQVSMSLCEIPPPSQELVEKYDQMKHVFYKRLLKAYERMVGTFSSMDGVSSGPSTQAVKDYAEELQTKPEFQALVKVATAAGAEAAPLLDKAREAALGAYGHYARPYVGKYLSDAVDHIKVYLDQVMPAE